MNIKGNLHKMEASYGVPVRYSLELGAQELCLNDLLGKRIQLTYLEEIHCIKCGRKTKTSFSQGYCYPCFISAPETEDCVLRPELCRAHEGEARDMQFAENHCLIDHYVYLAVSGGLKVGVTRHHQVPVRWIDQGARWAIILAKTPNRYLAGTIEVALKSYYSDKTNWREMLIHEDPAFTDLPAEKRKAINFLHPDFREYVYPDDQLTEIVYPVLEYPKKVKSFNLDKSPVLNGTLTGIKGQYLIFESGEVINIRKYGGYLVELVNNQ